MASSSGNVRKQTQKTPPYSLSKYGLGGERNFMWLEELFPVWGHTKYEKHEQEPWENVRKSLWSSRRSGSVSLDTDPNTGCALVNWSADGAWGLCDNWDGRNWAPAPVHPSYFSESPPALLQCMAYNLWLLRFSTEKKCSCFMYRWLHKVKFFLQLFLCPLLCHTTSRWDNIKLGLSAQNVIKTFGTVMFLSSLIFGWWKLQASESQVRRHVIQGPDWCSESKTVQERTLTLVTMNERKLEYVAQAPQECVLWPNWNLPGHVSLRQKK